MVAENFGLGGRLRPPQRLRAVPTKISEWEQRSSKNVDSLLAVSALLSRSQTIDNVGQLLWAWFSFLRKSADEIVEP